MTEGYGGWDLASLSRKKDGSTDSKTGSTVAGWTPINQLYDSELDSQDGYSKRSNEGTESSKKPRHQVKKPVSDVSEKTKRKRPSRAKPIRQSSIKRHKTTAIGHEIQSSSTTISSFLSKSPRASSGSYLPSPVSTSTLEKLKSFRLQVGPGGNDSASSPKPIPEDCFQLPVYQDSDALYQDDHSDTGLASSRTISCPGSFDEFGMIDDEDLMHLEIPLLSNESDSSKLTSQSKQTAETTLKDPFDDMEAEWASLDDNDLFQLIDLVEGACDGKSEHPINQYNSQQGNGEGNNSTISTSRNNTQSVMKSFKSRPPISRPPFPRLVRDRSPIHGVSATMNLRTCFRIGEALNSGVFAVNNNKDIIIELYARVVSSYREDGGYRQYFVFADLFHDRPPFLNGEYDLWNGSTLWEFDSQRFLGSQDPMKEKLCRCVGRVKKDERVFKFTVLNIWEASWDDVKHVKGIVCGSG